MLRFAKGLDFQAHPTIGDIYGNMPTIIEIIARRRLMMVAHVFQLEGKADQLMTKVLRELAARRVSRQDWMARPRRNFIDQLYEDLSLAGLGGLNFEEVVTRMKRPKEWEKTVDRICAAYRYL